jgi:hypothetical protein
MSLSKIDYYKGSSLRLREFQMRVSPPALKVTRIVHTFSLSSLEFIQISVIRLRKDKYIRPTGYPPQFVTLARSFPVPYGNTQTGKFFVSTPDSLAQVTAPTNDPSPPAMTNLIRIIGFSILLI